MTVLILLPILTLTVTFIMAFTVAFTVTLIALHPFCIPIHFASHSSKIDMLSSIFYLTGGPVGSPRNRLQGPAG